MKFPQRPLPSRPHILVIHTDQHRIDCLGAYGNPDVETPHIDRLAQDGVRFENSFCPFPVCTPSRYSLLSGRYVHDHRGWDNRSTLAPEIATFPKILRQAGYTTKAVGKMHFTPTYLDVGFDEMLLSEQDGPGRWDDDYHRHLMRHGLVDRNDLEDQRAEYRRNAPEEYWETCGALVSNLPEEHHSTTWIGDRALETIEEWEPNQPSLLMIGFIKPHHPFDPPAPWDRMYDPEQLTLLPGWTEQCLPRDLAYNRGYFPHRELTEVRVRRAMAYYYATISQIDAQVGRMIDALQAKGLYDDCLIVFTSDHGEYLGFHHLLLKQNLMYDPLVKVPLIIKWPGGERAGTASRQLVSNIDLAPTLCRAAGCQRDPAMKGIDLSNDTDGHRYVFAEDRLGKTVMVRSATEKLILTPKGHQDVFFNLEADPLELANLYDAPGYGDRIKRLEAVLDDWRCKETSPKPHQDDNAQQIDRPNVPPRDSKQRETIIEYYDEQMTTGER